MRSTWLRLVRGSVPRRCYPSHRCRNTPNCTCCVDVTPVSWLERVPTYKNQQKSSRLLDLATYGFLDIRCFASADILMYRAGLVL